VPCKALDRELGTASEAADWPEVVCRGQAYHIETGYSGAEVAVEVRSLASSLDFVSQSFIEEWKSAQDGTISGGRDDVVRLNLVFGTGGVAIKDVKLGASLADLF